MEVKNENYHKDKLFKVYSFTTERDQLLSFEISAHWNLHKDVSADTPVPPFSVLCFDVALVHFCMSELLQNYVASYIGYEDSKMREDLTSIVTKVKNLKKKQILKPEYIPMQIDSCSL